MPSVSGIAVDLRNVQGLVHHPYPLACSRFLLFHVDAAAAGQSFVRALVPMVATADLQAPAPTGCVNVGVSFEGLRALGVAPELLAEFPEDFKEGPSATVMGDLGASAPARWWAGRFATGDIHVLVQLACADAAGLDALTGEVRARAAAASVAELIPSTDQRTIDGRHLGDRRLHFGYRDGLSQPDVAWSDDDAGPAKVNFRHFLLGYATPDISSRPKEVGSRPASKTATALARDGSYAVFRWLHQDVATFNTFLRTEGPKLAPQLPPQEAEELLAAKLMGRWRDGTPLVLSPDGPRSELANAVDFTYNQSDPDGRHCPFASHIRVVNPRDQELGATEFGFVPRVIRRGTPFGPPLQGTEDDGQLRGLVGMFLCSSISAQFYKLMAWMKRTDFSPKFTNLAGQDPLADRQVPGASANFAIPSPAGAMSFTLPQFTRTLGTAFFFLPGVEGLHRLS